MTQLVIATRESALALWQAHYVKTRLEALYPELSVTLLGMTTQGDRILDVTLNKIGGKGLFVKELEAALLDGRADLAVHSLKDVPMILPEGLSLSAVLARHDPRDAWVSNRYARLEDLPVGAVVGTSSLRRESQLRVRFPHLEIRPLRGNVQTRLNKLDQGEYDGIVLAAAGLERLALADRIRYKLSPEDSLPAVGQGALGIEIVSSRTDVAAWLAPLMDRDTFDCVTAERSLSRALGGSCQVPIAGFAEIEHDEVVMRALVAWPDGRQVFRAHGRAPRTEAAALGKRLAAELSAQGAEEVVRALSGDTLHG